MKKELIREIGAVEEYDVLVSCLGESEGIGGINQFPRIEYQELYKFGFVNIAKGRTTYSNSSYVHDGSVRQGGISSVSQPARSSVCFSSGPNKGLLYRPTPEGWKLTNISQS